MYREILRNTLVLAAVLVLQGCWIKITVPEGGHVTGGSPDYFCDAGETCLIEVSDPQFSANFEAVPWEGWIFWGWHEGWKYLCSGSMESCPMMADNDFLLAAFPFITDLIETEEVFFLRPIFIPGTPIESAIAAVADPALRDCLQAVAADIGDISYAEQLPRLECGGLHSLDGLEAFVGLEQLELDDFENEAIDLSPLLKLVRLHTLAIVGNSDDNTFENTQHLADQLTPLTRLESLDLSRNDIHDLSPLAAPLARMKRLRGLNLFANAISDLEPLAELTQLASLNLLGNQIEDIQPLEGLTRLTYLELSGNSIMDLAPVSGLVELQTLRLFGNPLDNIEPLAQLPLLQFLNLNGTGTSDLSPLAGLARLELLQLQHNQLTDLDALAGLRRLNWLELADNSIADISGLAGLARLEYLDLGQNLISDTAALADMEGLVEVRLGRNQISEISDLSGLAQLSLLVLSNNLISEIGNLADRIPAGVEVMMQGNPLSCGEIESLLGMEGQEFRYRPLPEGCI